jgi:hypothetical protein
MHFYAEYGFFLIEKRGLSPPSLFSHRIVRPQSFAKLVKTLNSLLDTANIDLSAEGLHILTLDCMHVHFYLLHCKICPQCVRVAAHVFLLEVVLHADKAFRGYKWCVR